MRKGTNLKNVQIEQREAPKLFKNPKNKIEFFLNSSLKVQPIQQKMSKQTSATVSKSKTKNTQLTPLDSFKPERMIFSDVVVSKVGNTNITTKRVNISVLNKDGSVGDLIVPTERVFSMGVRGNKDFNDETKINGYSMPLFLWNKDGATAEEKRWIDNFTAVVDHCKQYIIDHREELELHDEDKLKFMLKKLNPLAWQKDKKTQKVIDGTGPSLWAKLISFKPKVVKGKTKTDEDEKDDIKTMFFDQNDNKLNPFDLIGARCFVKGAIKIESIFFGKEISLQVRLYEATVELSDGGMKPLLERPKPDTRLTIASGTTIDTGDDDEEPAPRAKATRAGSVSNSEDENEPMEAKELKPSAPTQAKPAPRKVVKAVKKQ